MSLNGGMSIKWSSKSYQDPCTKLYPYAGVSGAAGLPKVGAGNGAANPAPVNVGFYRSAPRLEACSYDVDGVVAFVTDPNVQACANGWGRLNISAFKQKAARFNGLLERLEQRTLTDLFHFNWPKQDGLWKISADQMTTALKFVHHGPPYLISSFPSPKQQRANFEARQAYFRKIEPEINFLREQLPKLKAAYDEIQRLAGEAGHHAYVWRSGQGERLGKKLEQVMRIPERYDRAVAFRPDDNLNPEERKTLDAWLAKAPAHAVEDVRSILRHP